MGDYRKLNRKLAALYPSKDEARMLVGYTSLPLSKIDFSGPAVVMWSKILGEAKKVSSGINELVTAALADYENDPVLKGFVFAEQTNGEDHPVNEDTPRIPITIPDKEKLKNLLSRGQVEEVLTQLGAMSASFGESFENAIILQKIRLNELNQQKMNHLITTELYDVERSKIVLAVLRILNDN